MTYGVIVRVATTVQMYDALHQELLRTTQGSAEGLLLHVARATADGFEVVEVWTDKAQSDRYNQEFAWPALARLDQGQTGPPPRLQTEEFEVRGLVLPGMQLAW